MHNASSQMATILMETLRKDGLHSSSHHLEGVCSAQAAACNVRLSLIRSTATLLGEAPSFYSVMGGRVQVASLACSQQTQMAGLG